MNNKLALSMFGILGLASCVVAPPPSADMPPRQVQVTSPTITYAYRGDKELIQANSNAMAFCTRYQSSARTANISNMSDGSKWAAFECLPTPPTTTVVVSPAMLPPGFAPGTAYTFATDRDMLDAVRNAETYCMNNGSQQAISTTVTNPAGTKTVTFRCTPA